MRKYCRAYRLAELRQFPQWTEKRDANEPDLTDDDIVYLWDDFVVVRNPVQDGGVLFDDVTDEWKAFCTSTLGFAIPQDLQYAYEQN